MGEELSIFLFVREGINIWILINENDWMSEGRSKKKERKKEIT